MVWNKGVASRGKMMGKTFPAPEKERGKKVGKREKREVVVACEEPIMIPVAGEGVADGGLLAEMGRRGWEEGVGDGVGVGGWKREVGEVECSPWF